MKKMPRRTPALPLAYAEMPAKGISALHNFRRCDWRGKEGHRNWIPNRPTPTGRSGRRMNDSRRTTRRRSDISTRTCRWNLTTPTASITSDWHVYRRNPTTESLRHIVPYVEALDEETRLLAVAAQGLIHEEKYNEALDYFQTFPGNHRAA